MLLTILVISFLIIGALILLPRIGGSNEVVTEKEYNKTNLPLFNWKEPKPDLPLEHDLHKDLPFVEKIAEIVKPRIRTAPSAKQVVIDMLEAGPCSIDQLAKAIVNKFPDRCTNLNKAKAYVSVIISLLKTKDKMDIKSISRGKYTLVSFDKNAAQAMYVQPKVVASLNEKELKKMFDPAVQVVNNLLNFRAPVEKTCIHCNKTKQIACFSRDRTRYADGFRNVCKVCRRKRRAELGY